MQISDIFRNCIILDTIKKNFFMFTCEKNEKTSRFKGIHWHKRSRKWLVQIHAKGQNYKYGGMFKDELDAAKRANQLCEELGIPLRNPEIGAKPKQQYQVTKNFFGLMALGKNQNCEN